MALGQGLGSKQLLIACLYYGEPDGRVSAHQYTEKAPSVIRQDYALKANICCVFTTIQGVCALQLLWGVGF